MIFSLNLGSFSNVAGLGKCKRQDRKKTNQM